MPPEPRYKLLCNGFTSEYGTDHHYMSWRAVVAAWHNAQKDDARLSRGGLPRLLYRVVLSDAA